MCRPRILILTAIASLALASAPALAQSKDAKKQAQKKYQQGLQLYKQGDYQAALESFMDAQALVPEVGNLYNIARCLHQQGKLLEAHWYYTEYLGQGGPNREKADAYISEIELTPAQIEVKSIPAGATITVDGHPDPVGVTPVTLELDPGEHDITAQLEGYETRVVNLKANFLEKSILSVEMEPTPETQATIENAPPPVPAPEPPPDATPPPADDPADDATAAAVVHEQPPGTPIANLLLVGGGPAIPIAFGEAYSFFSIDLSWELRIGRYSGVGLAMDVQVAPNGQIYAPVVFGGLHVDLVGVLGLFARVGLGAMIADAPARSVLGPDGPHADLMVRLDLGLSIAVGGFTMLLDVGGFSVLTGAGSLSADASAQYVPRLLLGYAF